jgi:hypothetical protein
MTIKILYERLRAIFGPLLAAPRVRLAGGVVISLGVMSPLAQAGGLPLVISATVDYTHGTLTISGQNFGSTPAVILDSLAFPTQSSGVRPERRVHKVCKVSRDR